MEALSREAILKRGDLEVQELEVPEWGGCVFLRPMSGAQRDEFEQLAMERRSGQSVDIRGLKVKLVCASVCNAEGKLLFAGNDDEKKLNEKSASAINRIFQAAARLNGLTEEDIQEIAENLQ